jgi:hypothetical protein
MNLDVEYTTEIAYAAQSGGEWLVIATCKSCNHRQIAARFHTEIDAKMWALQKNEPKAFAEFCAKMGGPDGVDPLSWLKGKPDVCT